MANTQQLRCWDLPGQTRTDKIKAKRNGYHPEKHSNTNAMAGELREMLNLEMYLRKMKNKQFYLAIFRGQKPHQNEKQNKVF